MPAEVKWVLDHIFPLMLLSMLHWVMAFMLLEDLKKREGTIGRWKWPWIIFITCVAFLGSVTYLLSHPSIFVETKPKK